jgi:hypothetical protein
MNTFKKLPSIALFFIFLCASGYAQSQTETNQPPNPSEAAKTNAASGVDERPVLEKLEPAIAVRGESVTVVGKLPKQPVAIEVQLRSIGSDTQSTSDESSIVIKPESVTVKEDGKTVSFVLPRNTRLGRYDVFVTFTQGAKKYESIPVPVAPDGTLRVVTKDAIKINAIYPVVSYPEKETFGFKIIGEGFSPLKEDNSLFIEGRGVVPLCKDEKTTGDCVNEEIIDEGREIGFSGLPLTKFQGLQKVQVRVGDRYSEKPITVTLSTVGRRTPALIAVGSLALIIGLVAFLLWGKKWNTTGGRTNNLLSAIFLDKETNTYSLSKFQFYMWTVAALFGYIYLTASRSLVQGDFTFADIPENLPGIILISVSTSALAVGITSAKGPKGAGDDRPSLSDFVTTGGLIAAERLQFFVWTVVGVVAFIFLTLRIEPGSIESLPAVPERFMYLMGISSFGYLGGKLARKPGPVMTQIEAFLGSLILQIHGSNLSPDATFKIDEKDVPASLLDKKKQPEGKPEVVTKDEQPNFAKVLRLTIDNPEKEWLEGEHALTITNPDGQKAVLAFTPVPLPATEHA